MNQNSFMRKILIIVFYLLTVNITTAQTWQPLDTINKQLMANSTISKGVCDDAGNIYVCGEFTNSRGNRYIAKWIKTQNIWGIVGDTSNSLNMSIGGTMVLDKFGNIYAAGFGNNSYVAYFNKSANSWIELGGTNSFIGNGRIWAINLDSAGNVYVGGDFKNSDGKIYVAKWTKTTNSWSELGGLSSLGANATISAVIADSSGNVYASGYFYKGSYGFYVAKWTKSTNSWGELGGSGVSTFNGTITQLGIDSLNNIYAAGTFYINYQGIDYTFVKKWDGQNWTILGSLTSLHTLQGNHPSSLYVTPKGDVYTGGNYISTYNVFKYTKALNSWALFGGLGINTDDEINTIIINKDQSVCIGGAFKNVNGYRYVSKFNGTYWGELSGGKNGCSFNNNISSVIGDSNGNVLVTGYFKNTFQNGFVAKRDSNSGNWSELGGNNSLDLSSYATNLKSNASGNIYLSIASTKVLFSGGNPVVTKWTKSLNSWSYFIGSTSPNFFHQLGPYTLDNNDSLFAIGQFNIYSGYEQISKWNGTDWIEIGGANSLKLLRNIGAIVSDKKGNIYVGGENINTQKNYVYKWDKKTNLWSALGNFNNGYQDLITNLIFDNNENLYAIGKFRNTNQKYYVAKWDGANWSELVGLNSVIFNDKINAITIDVLNNIYVAGDFTNSNNRRYVAKFDGINWSEVGDISKLGIFSAIRTIYVDKRGSLFIGGDFVAPLGGPRYIAKYSPQNSINEISGKIITPLKKNIKTTYINIYETNIRTILNSDSLGYRFYDDNSAFYYCRPTKNNDITKANGINATDVLFTQRHILNTTKLNSAYKLIAADVNGDKLINATDILRIKRLILGTDTTFTSATKGNRLWEFVDSAYIFPDTTNPFPFKDSISFTNLTSNKINQTFIGVKLGDVNYDWNPTVAKGASIDNVELIIDNADIKVDKQLSTANYQLPIKVKNFKDLVAMQYTLHFDNTKYEFVGIENNHLNIDFNSKQASVNGNITMLWTDKNAVEKTLEDGTELFTLVLRSTVNSRQSTDLELTLTNDITDIAAWDKDFTEHKIILSKQKTITDKPEIINEWAIYPNPTKGLVNLYVESVVGKGNIVIADVYGKQVKSQPLSLGTNTINIANLSKGIYFVSIITSDGKTTKKLVVE